MKSYRAKLAATLETVVALTVMVMNLQKLQEIRFLSFIIGIGSLFMAINGVTHPHNAKNTTSSSFGRFYGH
jgi:hypothetical protein